MPSAAAAVAKGLGRAVDERRTGRSTSRAPCREGRPRASLRPPGRPARVGSVTPMSVRRSSAPKRSCSPRAGLGAKSRNKGGGGRQPSELGA